MTSPITTFADLMKRLGGVPLHRVRFDPYPGTAVENDILEAEKNNELCEMVDRVLVAKAVGFRESVLSASLAGALNAFIRPRNLGVVSGAKGAVRLSAGLVRMPSVAFTSWDRLPSRRLPQEAFPALAPDLMVEVLCPDNTPGEMGRHAP